MSKAKNGGNKPFTSERLTELLGPPILAAENFWAFPSECAAWDARVFRVDDTTVVLELAKPGQRWAFGMSITLSEWDQLAALAAIACRA